MKQRKEKLKVFNPNKLKTIKEADEENDEKIQSPHSDISGNSDDSDSLAAIDTRRAELLLKRIAKITEHSTSIHAPPNVITADDNLIQNSNSGTSESTSINHSLDTALEPEVTEQNRIIEDDRENNTYSEWILCEIIGLCFTVALNYFYNYDTPSR